MGDFHDVEATDGVRFSWNVWPSSRLEATLKQQAERDAENRQLRAKAVV